MSHNNSSSQFGFSLIEIMVGVVVSSIVMGSLYGLWKRSDMASRHLQQKSELRNRMTLINKTMQNSITLAGYGLINVVDIYKDDATGSDTLTIYSNPASVRTTLTSAHNHSSPSIHISSTSSFAVGSYVAISDGTNNEIRKITQISGNYITTSSKFSYDYAIATSTIFPVTKYRYFSDQTLEKMMYEVNDASAKVIGDKIKNFQIAFLDKNGSATNIYTQIRSVNYSITGIYPIPTGEISAVTVSSNAIPRNLM